MCKWSSGCASSDKVKCKKCGVDLCKQYSRELATGKAPPGGNSAQCPAGKHQFQMICITNMDYDWPDYTLRIIINYNNCT